MKHFIVLRQFSLSGDGSGILHYLQGKMYRENELYTGWRKGERDDEITYLQKLGYIEIIQDIHTLVKSILLNRN